MFRSQRYKEKPLHYVSCEKSIKKFCFSCENKIFNLSLPLKTKYKGFVNNKVS